MFVKSLPLLASSGRTLADVQALLAILKFIIDLGSQEPLASIIDAQTTPGPSVVADEDLIEYVKNLIRTAVDIERTRSGTFATPRRWVVMSSTACFML